MKGEGQARTIGMPLPDVDVKIVDAEDPVGRRWRRREAGELILSAPQLMKGYWRDARRPRSAFGRGATTGSCGCTPGTSATSTKTATSSSTNRKKDMIG